MDRSDRKIMKISRESERFLNVELKDNELGLTDLNIIHELRKNQGSSQQKLSSILNVDKSLISRRMKFLVENDYIRVENSTVDKRTKLLYTTDKDSSSKKTRIYYESLYFEYLIDGLDQIEAKAFLNTLDKLYEKSKNTRRNKFKEVLDYESR